METSLNQMLASQLKVHIAENEDWLIKRILYYAKKNGYTAYTSTLEEAWRASISGISRPLLETPANAFWMAELNPHYDFETDNYAKFGMEEAVNHRKRGIDLVMFLGLFKYYRQSYEDLLYKLDLAYEDIRSCRTFLKRYFDRIELGFVSRWTKHDSEFVNNELVENNRNLINEKNLYLTCIESISQPVIVFNEDAEVKVANQAAAELFEGYSSSGRVYYSGQQVHISPLLKKKVQELLSNHKLSCELNMVIMGSVFDITFSRMKDVSGKFMGIVTVLNDITEKRNTESYLKESEALRKAFMEGMDAAALVLDMESAVITDFNQRAQTMFSGCDLSKADIQLYEVLGGEQESLFDLAEKGINNEERFIEIHNSKHIPVRLYCVEVWFQHRRHKIVIIFDISKEKVLEQRAFHLQKLEVLGDIAVSLPDMLSNKVDDIFYTIDKSEAACGDDDSLKALQKARDDLDDVSSIVNALRSIGAKGAEDDCVDMNQLIENCVILTKCKWHPYADIELDFCLKRKSMNCSPDVISQVFLNLILFASYSVRKKAEADGERGRITLSSRQMSGFYEIKIADTGIGIRKKDYTRIFDHSFTSKQLGVGTANGLAIVYDIVVKKHKGTIQFKSSEGKGTEFTLKIPTCKA